MTINNLIIHFKTESGVVKAIDGPFDTRALPKHARMDITFNEKGIFEYQCLFYKDREDEKGKIIVE